MKLTELSPELLRVAADGTYHEVEMLCEAHGIAFDCPQCQGEQTHRIYVWFADRDAPEELEPAARWGVSGLDLDTLTLGADVHCVGCAHFWVRDGQVS